MDPKDDQDDVPAEPNPRLFIGGLAWAATDDDLKKAFEPFGQVVSATVISNSYTGRSKGFGFVEFSSTEEAQKAKDEMNDKEIVGRAVKVDFAKPNNNKRDDEEKPAEAEEAAPKADENEPAEEPAAEEPTEEKTE